MANADGHAFAAPQLVRGNRGVDSRALVYDGYRYELNQSRLTAMYWRCCRTGCRASLKTNFVNVANLDSVMQSNGNPPNHNRGSDNIRVERDGVIGKMKDARPTMAIKAAYDEVVTQEHRNAGATGVPPPNIPDFNSVRSALQRVKKQQCPPIPHTINQVNFPGIYGQTYLRER